MLLRNGLLLPIAGSLLFAQSAGIAVRPAVTDYATRNVVDGVTLAASIVPPAEARKLFSKDLDHEGYIVVEVAVYPPPGGTLDVAPDEFTLRVGAEAVTLTSQSPAAIAAGEKQRSASKTKPPELPGHVHVYNTAEIGYESGGGPYGRRGGVYTGNSTTVAVGDPRNDPNYPPPQTKPPKGARPDRTALKQELESKELPAGRSGVPVAGYLYFLKPPDKQKSATQSELAWYRTAGQIRVSLPLPK
jgi:hypothetical protein